MGIDADKMSRLLIAFLLIASAGFGWQIGPGAEPADGVSGCGAAYVPTGLATAPVPHPATPLWFDFDAANYVNPGIGNSGYITDSISGSVQALSVSETTKPSSGIDEHGAYIQTDGDDALLAQFPTIPADAGTGSFIVVFRCASGTVHPQKVFAMVQDRENNFDEITLGRFLSAYYGWCGQNGGDVSFGYDSMQIFTEETAILSATYGDGKVVAGLNGWTRTESLSASIQRLDGSANNAKVGILYTPEYAGYNAVANVRVYRVIYVKGSLESSRREWVSYLKHIYKVVY